MVKGKKGKGSKEKTSKTPSTKNKSKKSRGETNESIPTLPPVAPFIPYDTNKPRKSKLSLQIDTTINKLVKPANLRSQSAPTLLPSHKLDNLCAKPFHEESIPAFQSHTPSKPHVCIWQFLNKDDLKTLSELHNREDIITFLGSKLPEDISSNTSADLLLALLLETYRFCRSNKMSHKKIASSLSIVYFAHIFFKSSLWQSAEATYSYIKESFLLHTIQRPPKSAEIFEPEECRSVLLYICKMYLRHLPLVQSKMMANYQLRLQWEPEPPVEPEPIKVKGKPDKNGKKKDKKNKGKGTKKK